MPTTYWDDGQLVVRDGRKRYSLSADIICNQAAVWLEMQLNRDLGEHLTQPADGMAAVKRYLNESVSLRDHEVFIVVFLNNRHRVLAVETLFHGTIDGASVHPREVVKAAMRHNAAAVLFAHNHPSGEPEPSRADIAITRRLVDALALVDVRALDHYIVGNDQMVSLAERGMM